MLKYWLASRRCLVFSSQGISSERLPVLEAGVLEVRNTSSHFARFRTQKCDNQNEFNLVTCLSDRLDFFTVLE